MDVVVTSGGWSGRRPRYAAAAYDSARIQDGAIMGSSPERSAFADPAQRAGVLEDHKELVKSIHSASII